MEDIPSRLPGLDLIRGIAVMGIALMNVASFALPPAAYDDPLAGGGASGLDLLVWTAEFVLVDGKLRALFSILFGASLLLVADRAEAAERDARGLHVRRMFWLLLIGLVHALLIWPGDILLMYALVGSAAFAFRDKPVGALVVAGLLCLAGQAIASAVTLADLYALRTAAAAPGADAMLLASWASVREAIGGSSAATRAAVTLHAGGYGSILADRLANAWQARSSQIEGAGLETIGFMLIGMAGLRSRALAGARPRRTYARIAAATIVPAALAGLALLGWCFASGLDPVAIYTAALLAGAPLRPLLALGYAALALATADDGRLAPAVRAVGRMALSCYIGTSILFSLIFDGYGFGFFDRLSRAQLLLPVALAWALMLLICPLWLGRFRHGPLEWLWRSLIHGRAQPFKRAIAI